MSGGGVLLCDLYEYGDGTQGTGQWFLLHTKSCHQGLWGCPRPFYLLSKYNAESKVGLLMKKDKTRPLQQSHQILREKLSKFYAPQ